MARVMYTVTISPMMQSKGVKYDKDQKWDKILVRKFNNLEETHQHVQVMCYVNRESQQFKHQLSVVHIDRSSFPNAFQWHVIQLDAIPRNTRFKLDIYVVKSKFLCFSSWIKMCRALCVCTITTKPHSRYKVKKLSIIIY